MQDAELDSARLSHEFFGESRWPLVPSSRSGPDSRCPDSKIPNASIPPCLLAQTKTCPNCAMPGNRKPKPCHANAVAGSKAIKKNRKEKEENKNKTQTF